MPRIISDIREFRFPGSFQGILRWVGRSAVRTIEFPDKSGTVALTSDLPDGSYLAKARFIFNPNFSVVMNSGFSSVVRNSAGNYTCTLASNAPNLEYFPIVSSAAFTVQISNKSQSSFTIILRNSSLGLLDYDCDVRVLN